MSNDVRSYLRLALEGDSRDQGYLDCPNCGGKGKLGFLRTADGIGFRCFRASCKTSGLLAAHGAVSSPTYRAAPSRVVYDQEKEAAIMSSVPMDVDHFLRSRYFLTNLEMKALSPRWILHRERVAFPIFGPNGQTRGSLLRSWDKQPKAITHPYEAEGALTSWYMDPVDPGVGSVVLVEDQISAVRASTFCTAVALLGASMTDAAIYELSMFRPTSVTVALDSDANEAAIALTRRLLGRASRDVQWVPLPKDMKDMERGALSAWMDATI